MPHLKSTHCLLAGICICLFVIMFRRQIISAINICSTYTGDLSRIVYPASDNITEDTPEIRHQNIISEILQSSTIMKEKLDKIRHEEDVEVLRNARERHKSILLFTYMRGGSTFVGSIFQNHPEAFYWYESLGPFYNQFLLEKFPAVNSVWFNPQFTPRDIKAEETGAIADFLDGMFSCDLRGIYPEAITHSFMSTSPSTKSIKRCVVFNKNNAGCQVEIPEDCKIKDLDERLAKKCHVKVESAHQCYLGKNTSDCDDPELQPYINRLKCYTSSERSSECLRDFGNTCKGKRLSVTKVHRLSMQSVEAIIERIPDVNIVYYVRDPRGIFVSRIKHYPCPIDALCEQMEKDYQIYTELKLRYPQSLHMMRYEDLATHPEEAVLKLFRFIDELIIDKTLKHMASITNATADDGTQGVKRADSVKTSTAWRDKISTDAYEISKKKCAEVLKALGYEP